MKKFFTFLIVLIIQIGIIYGLYRWYVSYDSNSLNIESSDTGNSALQPPFQARQNDAAELKKTITSKKYGY